MIAVNYHIIDYYSYYYYHILLEHPFVVVVVVGVVVVVVDIQSCSTHNPVALWHVRLPGHLPIGQAPFPPYFLT
ncbi:hypothetical protein Y032_0119g847 [Ancylostoma ceylanicum]|uniref:Uncharacterized protein n=1 Tax=Ancylostoma ceylanicum TaxID=53326 RepID=A0A016TB93_9BILA|nr:hypothetical protein Y032_0119g847 [Ancylostoma ceylanicum]